MKNKCLWCNKNINNELTLSFILSFQSYQEQSLCNECLNLFKAINNDLCCHICGRSGTFNSNKCSDCLRWQKIGDSLINHSFFQYNDVMKDYMQKYKFNGDYRLRKMFCKYFEQYLNSDMIIIPVPVSDKTFKQRGFNQVEGFLENVEYLNALLVNEDKQTQSHLNRKDRISTKQPFKLNHSMKNNIFNKNIIIVDDIYTTGTTMRHAGKLLIDNGAKTVQGLTLAR
ncbi:ComF family protein [Apilactobacillus timberlakei]|uniref:ComF family protein n=1 Tax=Apilactobacillus timberlakei TaxID=2008380 RepID=UPI00112CFB37|nr:ComF family protein [Apilactobacillus timberlakei]TPR17720.1 ComF family protein [Apilactobacillus timberlakei]